MTLKEAIESGRLFKRKAITERDVSWRGAFTSLSCFTCDDLIATYYELEPLPKKKKTVWIAVNPEVKSNRAHTTSSAFELKDAAVTLYGHGWPVYELEIEVEE